jgi:hypothetical protein
VCSPFALSENAALPAQEPNCKEQNGGSDEGYNDVPDEAGGLVLEAEDSPDDKPANDCANQAQNDVEDNALTATEQEVRQEAGDKSDDEPEDDEGNHTNAPNTI